MQISSTCPQHASSISTPTANTRSTCMTCVKDHPSVRYGLGLRRLSDVLCPVTPGTPYSSVSCNALCVGSLSECDSISRTFSLTQLTSCGSCSCSLSAHCCRISTVTLHMVEL